MKTISQIAVLTLAALVALNACSDESDRATGTAVDAYETKHAKLLTFLPKDDHPCYLGCMTQVYVALEVDEKKSGRDVIFVFVSGMDDDRMRIRSEYYSMRECLSHYDHG